MELRPRAARPGDPFTVTIAQGASAHLQAIVGYDQRRGTLFLRDPFVPSLLEALAEDWLETWRSTGPHGMAMVPLAQRSRLDGLALPDGALHEHLHRVHSALDAHDRDAAAAARDLLVSSAEDHRLAVAARRAVAAYDHDAERVLACATETATRFPDFAAARLRRARLHARGPASRRADRARQRARAGQPARTAVREALAGELAEDARERGTAARLIRRALRGRPDRHQPVALHAALLWSERRFEEALEVRRFAACLGRFDESASRSYLRARARSVARTRRSRSSEARVSELGARHGGPAQTLFLALDALGRSGDGLRALDAALLHRPEDGDLLLFAAEARGGVGDLGEASARVARAEALCKETAWLRGAASLALRSSSFEERRRLLERLLDRDPLDVSAQLSLALAVAAQEGAAAARDAIERSVHPAAAPPPAGARLRGLAARPGGRGGRTRGPTGLEVDPSDAWARRELTLALVDQRRVAEARAELEAAGALAPDDAALECARAALLRLEGDHEGASRALHAALEIDPDCVAAIGALAASVEDAGARAATLRSIARVVHERSVSGAGISAWYAAARSIVEPALLAVSLEELRARRADRWVTWTVSVRHRSFMGDHGAALALAAEACARFPLEAPVWSARADALLSAGAAVRLSRRWRALFA